MPRCPHCHHPLNPRFLRSVVARMNNRLRTPVGPPKVPRPCRYCQKEFGAREMRKHRPQCPKNPRVLRAARQAMVAKTAKYPARGKE